MSDKKPNSVSGRIILMKGRSTRYGRRVTATIERIDWSSGEVFEYPIKAWKEEALKIERQMLGGHVGLQGHWRKYDDGTEEFLVKHASPMRHINPAEIDVSKYL